MKYGSDIPESDDCAMSHELKKLYDELKKRINHSKLKELSVEIIDTYKEKNADALLRYAVLLGIDYDGINLSRLFARIIQNYHPDKIKGIQNEIDVHYRNKALAELVRFRNIYLFPKQISEDVEKYIIESGESYSYSKTEFGYDERSIYEDETVNDFEYDDLRDELAGEPDDGFIAAVNNLFVGNLDYSLTVGDLNNLEVELDLSDAEIRDLKGIEHCINVTVINLSGNNLYRIHALSPLVQLESLFLADNSIENIDCLSAMRNLRELDISFNKIEDISVLAGLSNLTYVNVLENPIRTTGIIEELLGRGVIVIY